MDFTTDNDLDRHEPVTELDGLDSPDAVLDAQPARSRGATAVEYALIIALIAAVILAAVGVLGSATQGWYQTTDAEMVKAGM